MDPKTLTHSPLPWKCTPEESEKEPDGTFTIYKCAGIVDAYGVTIYTVDMDAYTALAADTASFIVKAVNNYNKHLQAFKDIRKRIYAIQSQSEESRKEMFEYVWNVLNRAEADE